MSWQEPCLCNRANVDSECQQNLFARNLRQLRRTEVDMNIEELKGNLPDLEL